MMIVLAIIMLMIILRVMMVVALPATGKRALGDWAYLSCCH